MIRYASKRPGSEKKSSKPSGVNVTHESSKIQVPEASDDHGNGETISEQVAAFPDEILNRTPSPSSAIPDSASSSSSPSSSSDSSSSPSWSSSSSSYSDKKRRYRRRKHDRYKSRRRSRSPKRRRTISSSDESSDGRRSRKSRSSKRESSSRRSRRGRSGSSKRRRRESQRRDRSPSSDSGLSDESHSFKPREDITDFRIDEKAFTRLMVASGKSRETRPQMARRFSKELGLERWGEQAEQRLLIKIKNYRSRIQKKKDANQE